MLRRSLFWGIILKSTWIYIRKLKTFQSAQSANRIFPFNNRPLSSCQSLHSRQQFYVSIAYPNLLKCNGDRPSLDIIVALGAVLLQSAPFCARWVSVSLLDHDTPQSHALSTEFGGKDSIGHNWWLPFVSKINLHGLSVFLISGFVIEDFVLLLSPPGRYWSISLKHAVHLSLHPPQFIIHN